MTLPLKDVVIIIALVWFAWRALRDPDDRALRVVLVALVAQLLGETVVITALRESTGGALSSPVGKVLQNGALCTSFFALMLFFLMSAGGLRRRGADTVAAARARRRAGREGALFAVVLVVLAGAVATTPPELRTAAYPASGALEDAALHRPEVTGFYVVALAYFAYAASRAGWWALVYASESSPRARWGLRIAAIGMGLFSLAATGRIAFALCRYFGVAVPDTLTTAATDLVDLAVIAYIGGAMSVGLAARVAAVRVWWRHRRAHDELRPLWSTLKSLFPDDELDRRPAPRGLWHDRLSPRQIHRRYWRRKIEIRDGLVRLSPWMAEAGWTSSRPAAEQANVLAAALEQYRSGRTPSSPEAVLVTAPPAADTTIDSDTDELVELSRVVARNSRTV